MEGLNLEETATQYGSVSFFVRTWGPMGLGLSLNDLT